MSKLLPSWTGRLVLSKFLLKGIQIKCCCFNPVGRFFLSIQSPVQKLSTSKCSLPDLDWYVPFNIALTSSHFTGVVSRGVVDFSLQLSQNPTVSLKLLLDWSPSPVILSQTAKPRLG